MLFKASLSTEKAKEKITTQPGFPPKQFKTVFINSDIKLTWEPCARGFAFRFTCGGAIFALSNVQRAFVALTRTGKFTEEIVDNSSCETGICQLRMCTALWRSVCACQQSEDRSRLYKERRREEGLAGRGGGGGGLEKPNQDCKRANDKAKQKILLWASVSI